MLRFADLFLSVPMSAGLFALFFGLGLVMAVRKSGRDAHESKERSQQYCGKKFHNYSSFKRYRFAAEALASDLHAPRTNLKLAHSHGASL